MEDFKGDHSLELNHHYHSHESDSTLHLFESPHVPDDIRHGYHVVLGEEEEVEQEENDGGGDESQKVDVNPHAESLSDHRCMGTWTYAGGQNFDPTPNIIIVAFMNNSSGGLNE